MSAAGIRCRAADGLVAVGCMVCCLTAVAEASASRWPLGEPADILLGAGAVGSSELVTLDFDGDGFVDAATVSTTSFRLWRGIETGWADPTSATLPGSIHFSGRSRAVVGELTGDGRDDVLALVPGYKGVVMMRGREDGTPAPPQGSDLIEVTLSENSLAQPAAIGVADVDGDGDADALVAYDNVGAHFAVVLVNDGDGLLTESLPHLPLAAAPQDLVVEPLGGDDDPDLLVAERPLYAPPEPGGTVPAALELLRGASGAGFSQAVSVSAGSGPLTELDVGDFDEDAVSDLVLTRERASNDVTDVLTVLPGDPDADAFAAPRPIASGIDGVGAGVGPPITVADLDRDGHDDIYSSSRTLIGYTEGRRLLRGAGDLTFSAPMRPPFYDLYWAHGSTDLADVDGDGALDTVELTANLQSGSTQAEVHFGLWPLLRPEPESQPDIDMGQVNVGATGAVRTITFINDGPDTATDLTVFAAGDLEDFIPAGDTCSGETLAVNETCVLGVQFTPSETGERVLALAVAGEESDEVMWSPFFFGTGVGPASGGGPSGPPSGPPSRPPPPASPSSPAGTATRVGKARVLPSRRRARVRTGWSVTCAPGAEPCRVQFSIAATAGKNHRSVVVARRSLSLSAGESRALVAKATRRSTAKLRKRKRLSATMTISIARPASTPVSARADLKLRWRNGG